MFQCSSASRKFLNFEQQHTPCLRTDQFQCSSASRKFLNFLMIRSSRESLGCFSALQRAENFSIPLTCGDRQCDTSFSALQRAENFSIPTSDGESPKRKRVSVLFSEPKISQSNVADVYVGMLKTFQCSSASRKFLNLCGTRHAVCRTDVSVLFSEPKISQWNRTQSSDRRWRVSVLFSEPKISQSAHGPMIHISSPTVSVLFSEPKISQWNGSSFCENRQASFSALQRAENFSILFVFVYLEILLLFQCSSASRKFLNPEKRQVIVTIRR